MVIKKRVLSLFSLVMINVIAIDSLRNLPTNAANEGLSFFFFYAVATFLFLIPTILVTAELATHWPETGGVYVWVREAFGPQLGFFSIWLQWIYNVFWYPTILTFIAANIAYLIDPSLVGKKLFMLPVVLLIFVLATIANSYNIKVSSIVSSVSAIIGTLIPMTLIIFLGVIWLLMKKPLAVDLTWHSLLPDISGATSNMAFLVVVFFSLMGIEMSAIHAGEVKNPERNFPRALYYSALIIVISSSLSSAAIALVVPKSGLSIITGLNQAFELFLNSFHLKMLLPIIILAVILGGFGGVATWVIGPAKGLMVVAKDGVLPRWLSYQNKQGVPIGVLVAQLVCVSVLCGLFFLVPSFNMAYWILSDLTGQFALIFYIIFFVSAIKLRFKIENRQGFRIPGGNWGICLVGGVGIFACIGAFLIGFIPPKGIGINNIKIYETILISGLIVFSLPPLIIYKMRRSKEMGFKATTPLE